MKWLFSLVHFSSRAYLDVKELKEILQLDGSTHLNVFFANSSDEDLAGVATWPWDKEALTHLGRRHTLSQTLTHERVGYSYITAPAQIVLITALLERKVIIRQMRLMNNALSEC